ADGRRQRDRMPGRSSGSRGDAGHALLRHRERLRPRHAAEPERLLQRSPGDEMTMPARILVLALLALTGPAMATPPRLFSLAEVQAIANDTAGWNARKAA